MRNHDLNWDINWIHSEYFCQDNLDVLLLSISNFNKILVIICLLHPSISQLAPINIEQSFLFDISEISEIVHGWPGGQGVRVPGEAGAVITGERKHEHSDTCHVKSH